MADQFGTHFGQLIPFALDRRHESAGSDRADCRRAARSMRVGHWSMAGGHFPEVISKLLLVLPILAPALKPLGIDSVHFSIIFTHNMEIGLVHPPVGLNL